MGTFGKKIPKYSTPSNPWNIKLFKKNELKWTIA